VYRIGVVLPGGPYYRAVEGLKEGLKDTGFLEQTHYVLLIQDVKGQLGGRSLSCKPRCVGSRTSGSTRSSSCPTAW
jgi:hypothetical protein